MIYTRSGRVMPLLLVATVWYLVLTTVLSVLQYYVERRFACGRGRMTDVSCMVDVRSSPCHKSFGRTDVLRRRRSPGAPRAR